MKNSRNGKRILSVLLAAIMLLSTISVGIFAFAEDGQEEPANTINYVAIGDDEAAGINARPDGKKSYPELLVENYEKKGYIVNYTNYSQLYFGSNEIRKSLALDGYEIPEKYKQGNDFIQWEYIKDKNFKWNKDGKQPVAEEAIKNANVITINMGTNDFAYYTLFRVLDMMKFHMPSYPGSTFALLGFGSSMSKEVGENARVQQIMETVSEIKSFKQKADLEAALLSLEFVAPESIQIDDELKTAEMQIAEIDAMKPIVTSLFNFDTLSGHANYEKQKTEIERYKLYKKRLAIKAKAEKALANLKYTESGSILDASARKEAENQVETAKEEVAEVESFMEAKDLKGFGNIALQEKEIENFIAKQIQIEKNVFAKLIAGLTYRTADRITSIEDLGKASKQVSDIYEAIKKFEKIKAEEEPGYENIAVQEAAIAEWKEANKEAVEAENKRQAAYDKVVSTLKGLQWSEAGEEIPVYSSGFFRITYYYEKNWNIAKDEIKKAEEAIASYNEAYGKTNFDVTPIENLKANLREYGKKHRDELKKKNINVDENGEEIIVPEPEVVRASAPITRSRLALFALNAEEEAKVEEAEKEEEEEKKKEEARKQLEADKKAAEKALSGLTYTNSGSIRSENFLENAEKQYAAAAEALEKIQDDEVKASLEGYDKFKAQGTVIEHYKNGEWHKNAEKIQNENLAYSYKKTALTANAVGLGKDMGYLFASASKDVAKNYIRNYKAILKSINRLNPEAEVVVIGLHNPLENVEAGDVSSYVGKAVDAVNGALFSKTGHHFDVATVFYDGGVGSLVNQSVAMVVGKIKAQITAVTSQIRAAIDSVIATVRDSLSRISFFKKNKGNKTTKTETPVEPEEQKSLEELHREAEKMHEKNAKEACSKLTYLEPDSIKSKSDLAKAKEQYVAANLAIEKVLEINRKKIEGIENVDKQRKAMDRFRFGSLDKKKFGKNLTPVITQVNEYLKAEGTEAGIKNFHYVDLAKVDPEMPELELAPIIDFATSIDIDAIKKRPTSALGLLGPMDKVMKPIFGVGGTDLLWKYNTKNPLFPTSKGHEQIYNAVLNALGEKPFTKKSVSFGSKIKFKFLENLLGL